MHFKPPPLDGSSKLHNTRPPPIQIGFLAVEGQHQLVVVKKLDNT